MDVAAVDNGVVQGFIEVAQHGLLGLHKATLAGCNCDRVSLLVCG
jgi:hypothetical protein